MKDEEVAAAIWDMEDNGWELLGIFHSHPNGPPVPSATDVAQAYYPESLYIIFAPDATGELRARAFEIEERRVREVGWR